MAIGLAFHGVTDPKRQRLNRYPDQVIADRMEQARIAKDLTVEQAADLIGLGASSWYKKTDHVTAFKVAECGLFAAAIGAPTGWPFLDWTVGEMIDQMAGKKGGGNA